MPCVNCYISWAQELAQYAFVPLLVWVGTMLHARRRHYQHVYGPQWLPSFVGGFIAAYRLGADEDAFFRAVKAQYGAVVYLPWPLQQYMMTDADQIQTVYDSPRVLSFTPIRTRFSRVIFGSSQGACDSGVFESKMYPAHAKTLSKRQLGPIMARFVTSMQAQLGALLAQIDQDSTGKRSPLEVDAANFVTDMFFQGAVPSLFGADLFTTATDSPSHSLSPSAVQTHFKNFDTAFPLLASEILHPVIQNLIPPLRRGLQGREALNNHLANWIKAGLPGCHDGPILAMASIGATAEGFDAQETARLLLGTFWAAQANAPFAATHVLLHILQAPPVILARIRDEMDAYARACAHSGDGDGDSSDGLAFDKLASSDVMPLLTSAIYETLRLNSSAFSIRVVAAKEGYPVVVEPEAQVASMSSDTLTLDQKEKEKEREDEAAQRLNSKGQGKGRTVVIPHGARIVCATRLSQLESRRWESDSDGDANAMEWDAERFMGEEGARRVRALRSFGGGVSMCEGRHLALAEIKATVYLLLQALDMTILPAAPPPSPSPSSSTNSPSFKILRYKNGRNGIAPREVEGRVGMGIYQPRSGYVKLQLKRRRPLDD